MSEQPVPRIEIVKSSTDTTRVVNVIFSEEIIAAHVEYAGELEGSLAWATWVAYEIRALFPDGWPIVEV